MGVLNNTNEGGTEMSFLWSPLQKEHACTKRLPHQQYLVKPKVTLTNALVRFAHPERNEFFLDYFGDDISNALSSLYNYRLHHG
ncbi:hypothetical protein KIN20_030309 [Parelaphostrongylus tenuis]|uniref:Uncharacterized protein n=1 Tax=Parelaphostrongylus tenuis TaxID=148309 RepID=A0AAD5R3W0_PARTN|nr:hypothetical protein KIN20_030309 [Parelaphostrongylus tenuis]